MKLVKAALSTGFDWRQKSSRAANFQAGCSDTQRHISPEIVALLRPAIPFTALLKAIWPIPLNTWTVLHTVIS
jgi:hypothetical protein